MTRRITPRTSLDNLKKEAKRWLKALRVGDAEARSRFERSYPDAPANPALRDVQHALAREYSLNGWTALKVSLAAQSDAGSGESAAELADRFLEYACPDHHVRGGAAHRMARHAAMRILARHPEIARDSIYTAVVCGEVEEVERLLRERPELANARRSAAGRDRSGAGQSMDFLQDPGAKDWTPLLFLCFTRLPLPAANDNAVTIARVLLDHGADPNAFFMAGDSRYTPLTGVAGEGEENRPPHPRRDELARTLLERGADPYDLQVVYDIHFRGNVLWYLQLAYEYSEQAGRKADWDDPDWGMFDMGGYGSGARWHLQIAIDKNDRALAAWCLAHGANSNAAPPRASSLPQRSLYEQAAMRGRTEIAELLVRYGAKVTEVVIDEEEAFISACMRLDRAEVDGLLTSHPEYLQSTKAIFAAAKQDRSDVVELLLDLGVPIEIEDAKRQRPLHVAAHSGAQRVAELLIARGASTDPVESSWHNMPIDFAVYNDDEPMIKLLARHTRDVGNLVFTGRIDRLREVLSDQPQLAKQNSAALLWLPEDESIALQIVKLLLERGADADVRNRDDMTAAEIARKRGMNEVAALLAEESKKK